MTEQGEILRPPFPRIYTPAEFDARLESDPLFADNIAGYTSFSVEQLLRGVASDGTFHVATYPSHNGEPHISIRLHKIVFEALANRPIPVTYPRFPEDMYENRGVAPFWIAGEEIQQATTDETLVEEAHIKDFREDFLRLYNERLENPKQKDVLTLLYNLELDRGDRFDPNHIGRVFNLINRLYPQPGRFIEVLDRMKAKKGVQILYRDKTRFIDFVSNQAYQAIDDNGVEVYQPIPEDLVVGIVALGEYEQNILSRFRR